MTHSESIEALYIVEFGDIAAPGFRNGGVVVLETGRIFGGDSGYYYIGHFSIKDNLISASATVVKHNPDWSNAFGDTAKKFEITFSGTMNQGMMTGVMHRTDLSHIKLPIRLKRTAELP